MSVEGLLSEVSTILGSRLTIKAADQAFFGDRQVYTNVPLASTSGKCDKGGIDKKQKRGGQDELSSAIQKAENIIDKALSGQAVHCGSNVNSEIAALKKENQEIKKEVAELRKLLQDLTLKCCQRLCFGDSHQILILGDGNLSFSLSLAKIFPSKRITATVLECEEQFVERYREGLVNMDALRQMHNVETHFCIDATDLPLKWKGTYDTIIMNFPHPGGKTNLKKSRKLARSIFKSLQKIIDDGEFHLSLAGGQSGIPYSASPWSISAPHHFSDSWQILNIAAEEGFCLQEVLPIYSVLFPGYKSSGYRSTTKGFDNFTSPQRLVFVKCDQNFFYDEMRTRPTDNWGMFSLWRPYFIRDISFLFSCTEDKIRANEATLLDNLREIGGSLIIKIDEVKELRSTCPDPLLPNRIYRIFYQSHQTPLSRHHCNQLDNTLRRRIMEQIAHKKLPLILT